ncbi:clavaminate synthase-like protein At3g21360 [Bidens hawaiensis]|uniref:clavaminate synthase-like protein At3g21360 n=1 Tax=Bidens hawaiensis TaxID=980011 RepID=UPI004049F068
MATGRFFQEANLPEQKSYGNGADGSLLFPVVLSPITNTDITVFEEATRLEKQWLESLLQKSGVILFRGFPVTSPSDFNDVVEAFGFPEMAYMGGRAPRTKVVGRVYTANESPLDKQNPFHHEMAYIPDFPSKVFFFCEEEPGIGGETPIVLSHIVYEKMKDKHPEFVAQIEKHGLTYKKIICDEERPMSTSGRSWKSAYMTDDKNVAEQRAAELATKLEWMENAVKLVTGPLPATRLDKENQRKTWFNHLVLSNTGPMHDSIDNQDTYVELGNGDPVPDIHVIKDCLKLMEQECVAIPWKKGDVMLINNLMVLHGRQPLLKPPRQILASLCK